MPSTLRGVRAKVSWAEQHLSRLDAELQRFYTETPEDGKPYEIGSEFRPETSEYVFWIEPVRKPPLELGLILGDFAHNLRSALDHLVCQLARLTDPDDSCETTQFPIRSSPDRFKSVEPTWLRGVAPEHRAIIEQYQPYDSRVPPRGEHFLTLLNTLDNVDKHRIIHPTFGYLTEPAPGFQLTFVANADAGTIRSKRIANGRRIVRKTDIVLLTLDPAGPGPRVDMYGDLAFEPAFGEKWIKADVLPQLVVGTRRIIEGFAPDFPG